MINGIYSIYLHPLLARFNFLIAVVEYVLSSMVFSFE